MRTRNHNPRTIKIYVQWIKRFIVFYNKTHPPNMGKEEIRVYLTHLAVEKNVSPSTQNQALQALLFLYRNVLESPVGWIDSLGYVGLGNGVAAGCGVARVTDHFPPSTCCLAVVALLVINPLNEGHWHSDAFRLNFAQFA